MALKKSVCKACRAQAFGKENSWNEFAEAWFEPTKIRRGSTVCPFTVIDKLVADISCQIKKKIHLTPAMKAAIKAGNLSIGVRTLNAPTWYSDRDSNPPLWCPFSEYHAKKGESKLPKRIPYVDLNKDKGKYPPGTKLWHGVPVLPPGYRRN